MPKVFPRASRFVLSARPDNLNGLIAWYTFDSLFGTTRLVDRSGHGNYAFGSAGAVASPSPFGPAMVHGGSAFSNVTIAPGSGVYAGLPLTFAFWLQLNFLGAAQGLLSFTAGAGTGALSVLSSNALRYIGNPAAAVTSAASVINGLGWTHIALALTSTGATIFANGIQVATNASVGTAGALSALNIGSAAGVSTQGRFADFRVYNRILAPTEVYQIYGAASNLSKEPEMMALSAGTVPNIVSIIGAGSNLFAQKPAENIFVFI